MGVSNNRGTPKSSIFIGFSIIHHSFWVPLFLETPISKACNNSITPAQFQQYLTSVGLSVFHPRACNEDRPFKCLSIFGPPKIGKSDAASGMNAFIKGTQITTTSKQKLQMGQWLNQWSKDCGRRSFHIVHKHHSFMHLLYNSRYMNPKAHWCFKAEDYVGHISRLTHSISMYQYQSQIYQIVPETLPQV